MQKYGTRLLLFSLFGLALWFFGNLYEGIVIAPNLLADPIKKLAYWQGFFTLTNPLYFYIPIAPLASLATFVSYFCTPQEKAAVKRHLRSASLFVFLGLILGVFIVIRINLRLFFGDISQLSGNTIYRLSLLWNILNILRLMLLSGGIYHVFNACLLTQQKAS
jgi:hypothetical protein